jgi:hypothetical protein
VNELYFVVREQDIYTATKNNATTYVYTVALGISSAVRACVVQGTLCLHHSFVISEYHSG